MADADGSLIMAGLSFPPPIDTPECEALRAEVRAFLEERLAGYPSHRRAGSWFNADPDFTEALAKRGWIGMTWPSEYGGGARSALERYVVVEETLAAGAPVGYHWIADRQSGPTLLKFGTEAQRRLILPRIVAGTCCFCIGMSEPDSGSDLAAVRTRADPVDGGFVVNGAKVWTSFAHQAHYMILFCRTAAKSTARHDGFSQFLVDMTTPGITVRPILDMLGRHHFNEVVFSDVRLEASALIGELGAGWQQVMSELAFERSGPERFLSSFALFVQLVRRIGSDGDARAEIAVGRLAAHLVTLRRLSRSIATMLERGDDPALPAAMVKDLGNMLEQEIPEIARLIAPAEPRAGGIDDYVATLAETLVQAPVVSLRGGSREVLRGMIARGVGLR